MKNIFIPLKKQFYEAFRDGSKVWELRGNQGQFNYSRIIPGRKAILAWGYGYPRLVAHVVEVRTYDSIAQIPKDIYNLTIPPKLQNPNNLGLALDLTRKYNGWGFVLIKMEIEHEIMG